MAPELSPPQHCILEALEEGERRTAELAKAINTTSRTVRRHASELAEAGLVDRPKQGRLRLTSAGREALDAAQTSIAIEAGDLQPVVDALPAPALAAFVRLMTSAIVAKHHLFDAHETGWPSFRGGGPPARGKTLFARIVERLLGLDGAVKHVQSATEGELIGRRHQTSDGWVFEPSPYWGQPFVALDEFDKGPDSLQRQALYLLQGDSRVTIEGQAIEVRPIPLVTLNKPTQEGLTTIPDPYIRRSVVLDTDPIAGELTDIDLAAPEILKSTPRLDLTEVAPTRQRLSDDEFRQLRDLLKSNLTDEGWGLADAHSAAILAVGRTALSDPQSALYETVSDLLACAETLGHIESGWRRRLCEAWPATPADGDETSSTEPPAAVVSSSVPADEDAGDDEAGGGTPDPLADVRDRGAFAERRAELAEQLRLLKSSLYPLGDEASNRSTRPLREKIDLYIRNVERVDFGDWPTLDAASELFNEVKAEAGQRLGAIREYQRQRERQDELYRELKEKAQQLDKIERVMTKALNRRRTRAGDSPLDYLSEGIGAIGVPRTAPAKPVPTLAGLAVGAVTGNASPTSPEPAGPQRRWRGLDGADYDEEKLRHWQSPAVRQLIEIAWNQHYKTLKEIIEADLEKVKSGQLDAVTNPPIERPSVPEPQDRLPAQARQRKPRQQQHSYSPRRGPREWVDDSGQQWAELGGEWKRVL